MWYLLTRLRSWWRCDAGRVRLPECTYVFARMLQSFSPALMGIAAVNMYSLAYTCACTSQSSGQDKTKQLCQIATIFVENMHTYMSFISSLVHRHCQTNWTFEYARYMIEGTPVTKTNGMPLYWEEGRCSNKHPPILRFPHPRLEEGECPIKCRVSHPPPNFHCHVVHK